MGAGRDAPAPFHNINLKGFTMAKPETYKGDDAVKIKCLRDYTVEAGTGQPESDNIEFEKGKTYTLPPRSAAHMLRKVYATYDKPTRPDQKRGVYLGDAPFFVDETASKEMAEAEKKPTKTAAKKDADE